MWQAMAEAVFDEVNANLSGKSSTHILAIINLLSDRTEYKRLALSSFAEYERRLNWPVNAGLAAGLMRDVWRGRNSARRAVRRAHNE